MTSSSADSGSITLIHVFKVEPEHQQELVDLLSHAYASSISHVDGFIGSNLYRAVEGDKVTLHVRWRSLEDYEAMLNDASMPAFLYHALRISTFEAGRYDFVRHFAPATASGAGRRQSLDPPESLQPEG